MTPIFPHEPGQKSLSHERARTHRARRGLTLLELVVALPILLITASMSLSILATVQQQRTINREGAVAAERARSVLESMRNEEFGTVLALYNADPLDDPGGPGTAPGNQFEVPGLVPDGGNQGEPVGIVRFPLLDTSGGGGLPNLELREDMQDELLGLPRDLNGDFLIDDDDHASDYRILPVLVEIEWAGALGPRRFRVFTILTEFQS